METEEQIELLQIACDEILQEKKVRFIGVINKMGRLVTEKYQKGIKSLLQDKENRMIHMELALEIFLRDSFNEKLGEIEYVLSKRKKVNLISIPMKSYLILISTNPTADVDSIVKKTLKEFKKLLK